MNEHPLSQDNAVSRLLAALQAGQALTCAEAEALLPEFVDAEQLGADVDDDPRFQALLQHLDTCEACLNLYEQLSEDAVAMLNSATLPPIPATLKAPVFFPAPIKKGEHILLQVLEGLVRRFTLSFELPRLMPSVPTLGVPRRSLYNGALHEVAGQPLLTLTALRTDQGLELQVAVRELGKKTQWQIDLQVADQTLRATTDARGVAQLVVPASADLSTVRLQCVELPS